MIRQMTGDEDILELHGQRIAQPKLTETHQAASTDDESAARFLSVWFRCCHVYGRMMRNRERTEYIGRCPRCGARVRAGIGEGGTRQRLFQAY